MAGEVMKSSLVLSSKFGVSRQESDLKTATSHIRKTLCVMLENMKYKFLVMLILSGASAFSQISEVVNNTTPYIEVIGNASEKIMPDRIIIEVTLVENGKSGAKESIPKQEQNLVEALVKKGIPETRLTKEGASTDFIKVNWFNDAQVTRSIYLLELRNSKEVASAFALFKDLRVEHAILAKSTHSRLDSLQQAVEIQAIVAAKNKANKLLQAIGSKTGKPILITQNQSGENGGVYFINGVKVRGSIGIPSIAYEAPFIEQEPVIEIQKLAIEASILVRFEIN